MNVLIGTGGARPRAGRRSDQRPAHDQAAVNLAAVERAEEVGEASFSQSGNREMFWSTSGAYSWNTT
jgi:hypothetical protein